MIKFFRKIRQRLVKENKISNYLLYAIGEIVLVVIGILIALQINNWNETRKFDIQEQSALNNIHRDFLKNEEILKDVKNSSLLMINSGIQILNHTGNKGKPDNEDTLNNWLNKLYNSTPYYPQNDFLDDLLSSGKLGIFKNVELRNLLSSWKPEVEILEERFNSVDENDPEVMLIKRVIGLPGETIRFTDQNLYINDVLVTEDYINEICTEFRCADNETVLGDDEYFVMGDNRNNSQDSRRLGAIPLDHIVGRVVFRYWPPERIAVIEHENYDEVIP